MGAILNLFRGPAGLVNLILLVVVFALVIRWARSRLATRKAAGFTVTVEPVAVPQIGPPVAQETPMQYTPSQVCGTYLIAGSNPGAPEQVYSGELTISQAGDVLLAHWEIGPQKQAHEGTGLLAGDKVAVAFQYMHPEVGVCGGIVVYDIVSEGILHGRWTGIGGTVVGLEECRRKDIPAPKRSDVPRTWGRG